jgi:hypothetical protein
MWRTLRWYGATQWSASKSFLEVFTFVWRLGQKPMAALAIQSG